MFLHREVIKQSWKIVWRSKYLWFFGFFAVFFSGHSGLEIITRGLGIEAKTMPLIDTKTLAETGIFNMQSVANLGKLLMKDPFSTVVLMLILLLILVIVLFVIWLSNVSQAAIVNNVACISENKDTNFQEGVMTGMKSFWPVFILNIFKKVAIFIIFALMSLPLLMSEGAINLVPGNIIFSILFVLLVPVIVSLAFVVNFAISYVVIKKEKFNSAVKQAIGLFTKNWLVSIEMGFLIYLVSLLVSFGAILLMLLLVTPFLLLSYFAMTIQSVGLFGVVIAAAFIAFILIIVFFGAILSTFQNSASTLFFIKLVGGGGTSKIVRVFDKNQRS
jgi:hypothetical protein